MAENVFIEGVDRRFQWALETTQQEVADYLRTIALFHKSDLKEKPKKDREDKDLLTTTKKHEKHGSTTVKNLKEIKKGVSNVGEFIADLPRILKNSFIDIVAFPFNTAIGIVTGTIDAIGTLGNATTELIKGFIVGGASVQRVLLDFAQKVIESIRSLGLVGEIIAGLTLGLVGLGKFLNSMHDSFMDLYNSGLSLNGSFLNLMKYSAAAGLTFGDAAQYLKNFSEVVVALNTDYKNGAETFLQLQYNVRKSLIPLGMLSLTTSEITEFMGEYLETQKRLGLLQNLDQMKTTSAITDYIKQVTLLSQITGKRRDQVAQEMEEIKRDTNWTMYISSKTQDQINAMNTSVGAISGILGPQMAQVYKDLTMVGVPLSDFGQRLQAIEPGLFDAFNTLKDDIAAGRISGEDINKEVIRITKDLQDRVLNMTDAQKQQLATMGIFGDAAYAEISAFFQDTLGLDLKNNLIGPMDTITNFFSSVSEKLNQLMKPILETISSMILILQENGTFDTVFGSLDAWISNLTNWLNSNKEWLIKEATEVIGSIGEFVSKIFSEEGRKEIWADFKRFLNNVWDSLTFAIEDFMQENGLGMLVTTRAEEIGDQLTNIQHDPNLTDEQKSIQSKRILDEAISKGIDINQILEQVKENSTLAFGMTNPLAAKAVEEVKQAKAEISRETIEGFVKRFAPANVQNQVAKNTNTEQRVFQSMLNQMEASGKIQEEQLDTIRKLLEENKKFKGLLSALNTF